MQMVILAGGLATRLRPLTESVPKSMVLIEGRPFLEYQVELLKRQGITDIVLCVGYLGDRIKEYFGGGERFGVQIRYSEEGERLLGTAGAIKKAEPLLADKFFVMYGDSYLLLDYAPIMHYFESFDRLALMVVFKNFDRWDQSNVIVEGNRVKVYQKGRKLPGMDYIDAGVSLLKKEALRGIPAAAVVDLVEFSQRLIEKGELLAYETQQRFYEIGSPQGLEEFTRLVASGGIRP